MIVLIGGACTSCLALYLVASGAGKVLTLHRTATWVLTKLGLDYHWITLGNVLTVGVSSAQCLLGIVAVRGPSTLQVPALAVAVVALGVAVLWQRRSSMEACQCFGAVLVGSALQAARCDIVACGIGIAGLALDFHLVRGQVAPRPLSLVAGCCAAAVLIVGRAGFPPLWFRGDERRPRS